MTASLAVIAITWGLIALLVFRHFTNHEALRTVRKRIHAHLLGIRLYSDEPSAVWKAQKAVIKDNLRFLALIAKPLLILAIPFAFLYPQLDAIYGRMPLEPGHSATVTLHSDTHWTLTAPPGIVIETPPIHIYAEHETVWRIRALSPTSRSSLSRSITAGDHESKIDIDYPESTSHWLAWFLVISTVTAAIAHFGAPRASY